MTQTCSQFVRLVINPADKVLCVVLCSDRQVQDVKSFCFHESDCVLTFDKTYNLGCVYVTPSVYTNKALLTQKTGDQPIFVGPTFIHGDSTYVTYKHFFSHLAALLSDLQQFHGLTLGWDEEYALRKAMKHEFPGATFVTCTRHLKQNTAEYLTNKTDLDSRSRSGIVSTLFGDDGLARAEDLSIFDDTVDSLYEPFQHSPGQHFASYFRDHLVPLLRGNISAGRPGWTSNNAESFDHAMKQMVQWQPHMMPDLILKLKSLVDLQTAEEERAVYGRGNYILRQSHIMHLRLYDEWQAMTDNQRHAAVKACYKLPTSSHVVVSTDGTLATFQPPSAGRKGHQRTRRRPNRTRQLIGYFRCYCWLTLSSGP